MKSQLAFSLIGPYDSTTVVDPFTVKGKFKSSYAPFLDSAAQPFLSIMSPTATEKFGKDIAVNPTGTGPYKFESYQIDNVVRMVRTRITNGVRPFSSIKARRLLTRSTSGSSPTRPLAWQRLEVWRSPVHRGLAGRQLPGDAGQAATIRLSRAPRPGPATR